jgi:hypothetical protein
MKSGLKCEDDIATCMPTARQRAAKHISAKANALSNRTCIARQRRGNRALSTIQAVFTVGTVQNVYKIVEFRSRQIS